MERERVQKKLKAQERELQGLQTKAAAHQAKVAQLEQQIEDLDAGNTFNPGPQQSSLRERQHACVLLSYG